ncbi:protein kinase domain-containing protein [Candidatus Berkiella aquae]|uniref:Protein kinase n=1 Tax=Candidatus Berkiella aquae TaxID=295108 RepID=A0A0Q9YQK1_9GAMM|nr:protein kinase [Candidatus Berkiella aquae]MCS5709923.1 protein kinase [Candidatus Berkiella aquae]
MRRYLPAFVQHSQPKASLSLDSEDFQTRWQSILKASTVNKLIGHAKVKLQSTGTFFDDTVLEAIQTVFKASDTVKLPKNESCNYSVIADIFRNVYAVYHPENFNNNPSSAVKLIQNLNTHEFCVLKVNTDKQEFLTECEFLQKYNQLLGVQMHHNENDTCKYYIMMKLVPGVSWDEFLKLLASSNDELSTQEQAQILLSLLEALQAMFAKKIHHHDLHQYNVMFDPLCMATSFIDFAEAKNIIPEEEDACCANDLAKIIPHYQLIISDLILHKIINEHLLTQHHVADNLAQAIEKIQSIAQIKPSLTKLAC